jgi:hypothetical protein
VDAASTLLVVLSRDVTDGLRRQEGDGRGPDPPGPVCGVFLVLGASGRSVRGLRVIAG